MLKYVLEGTEKEPLFFFSFRLEDLLEWETPVCIFKMNYVAYN